MLAFTHYVSTMWAAVLGVLFIAFRQYYSYMYVKNPPERKFPLGFFVNGVLVIGSLIGIVMHIVHTA